MTIRQELAEKFFSLREEKDVLAKTSKDLNKCLEEIEKQLILQMENENLQNFRDADHGLIYLREDIHATIEDPDQAFKWLREHNMSDIIKETVHSKTLSVTVKDHGEIPGVKSFYQTKIGFKRDKSGGNDD